MSNIVKIPENFFETYEDKIWKYLAPERAYRACESAYWKLKPYRTRWQKWCLKQAKLLPWGRLKYWFLSQART